MLSEALALVAVPSRIKVNYHILFLTGHHHLLAGQHARTHTYSHTSSQVRTRSEKTVSVSYKEVRLHMLGWVVPRHLTEAHSFPITLLVNHTHFIPERKKKAKKHNTKNENNNKRSCRISARIQRAWLALSLHNTSSRTWNDRWVDRGVWRVWSSEPQRMIVSSGRCQTIYNKSDNPDRISGIFSPKNEHSPYKSWTSPHSRHSLMAWAPLLSPTNILLLLPSRFASLFPPIPVFPVTSWLALSLTHLAPFSILIAMPV